MAEAAQFQINLAEYQALRDKGAVKIVLMNGKPHYTQKKFNPETGAPEPILQALDRDSLVKAIDDLKKNVDQATMLLADIDAAKEVL